MEIALAVLPALAFAALLAWLGRRFILWYFRIPEAVALLRSIDESLKQLPVVRQHNYRKSQGSRAA